MILLIFFLMNSTASALSLEEVVSLYEQRNRDRRTTILKREMYEKNFKDYQRYYYFNVALQDSGTQYVNYREDQTHLFAEHRIRNTFTPSLNVMGVNFYTNLRSDYLIDRGEMENRLVSFGASVNLIDLFYYGDTKYGVDVAYLQMRQQEEVAVLEEIEGISNLIDEYLEIKKFEGSLDIKERALVQLMKEREYIEEKFKAGSVSQMDVRNISLNVNKIEQEIVALRRRLSCLKMAICEKIGLSFEDQNFSDFESEEIEDVFIDDSEIIIQQQQIELDRKKIDYEFRQIIPDVRISAEYDWNEALERYDGIYGLTVGWDIVPNTSSYDAAKKALEIDEIKLQEMKDRSKLKLENKRDEYISLKESLSTAAQERDFLQGIVELYRDMYKAGMVSFQEFMRYQNQLLDKEIEVSNHMNDINSFRRKMKLFKLKNI